ncbi:MAG: alcohol dehydrogenase class IV [Myxococcota bacterium]|jgi:alcohol dehydrogenase class IV
MRGNWNYPTTIRFGAGRISELAEGCSSLGMSRPLLITDAGLSGLPIVRDALAANTAAGMPTGLFSEVQGNPVGANVDAGVAAYKAGGHDGVIAFGGGSALDVGKAVALMLGQDRPLWDFEDIGDNYTRVNITGIAPVVAVPTTAGTGSEVGRASVITDESDHTKKIIFHPSMLPALVIADPALTVGLPPHLTAWTGIDALSHCLEAFCAPGFHPQADGIAVEGIRLIRLALERAVVDGSDIEARSMMMAASSMGATAFQKGLGAMHALSHPVGALLNAHHGLTNAVFMPYVLAFNKSAIEDRIGDLARYIGLEKQSFEGFLEWVLLLRERLSIPHTSDNLGVTEALVDDLGRRAAADPSAGGNPIPVDVEALSGLYRQSLLG